MALSVGDQLGEDSEFGVCQNRGPDQRLRLGLCDTTKK